MPGVITISCLGTRGRAGNSCFQYAFAKGYAKAMGCELQTPMWWGRNVFQEAADDPPIDHSLNLPRTHCDSVTHQLGLPLGYFFGKTDIDLQGYMQHQFFLDFYSRRQVREWFKIKPELDIYSPEAMGTNQYSAKHIRRGDYMKPPFDKFYCTVSDESYDRAIEKFNIPAPIIPVFEGCGSPTQHLVDLGVPWLHDWLILRDADHLLRANSSFSWFAGACGHGKVFSPVVEKNVGLQHVCFVEGNHPNLAGVFQNQSELWLKEE